MDMKSGFWPDLTKQPKQLHKSHILTQNNKFFWNRLWMYKIFRKKSWQKIPVSRFLNNNDMLQTLEQDNSIQTHCVMDDPTLIPIVICQHQYVINNINKPRSYNFNINRTHDNIIWPSMKTYLENLFFPPMLLGPRFAVKNQKTWKKWRESFLFSFHSFYYEL